MSSCRQRLSSLSLLTIIAALLSAAASHGVTIHVPDQVPTIQGGIIIASDGDIVELADGIYTGLGNRDIDFLGKAITVRSASGNPTLCVIDCEATDADRHRGFYFHSGEGSGSLLEGVTITNGYMNSGGGVLCELSSPTILRCLFTTNHAEPELFQDQGGGGIACHDHASPAIMECTFQGNTSGFGGAMHIHDNSSPTVMDCDFSHNNGSLAGAVFLDYYASPDMSGCRFTENSANSGGALFSTNCSGPVFTDCEFLWNVADGGSGGAFMSMGCGADFTDCIFRGNSSAADGGAIGCYMSEVDLLRCVLYDNSAVDRGGAISCVDWSLAYAWSSTFYGNTASEGAALSAARLESSVALFNSIVAFSTHGEAIHCELNCDASLSCSDVYGNAGGDWVGCIADQLGSDGNITADPIFCGPENGDFRLRSDSPCLPGNHPDDVDCGLIGALGEGCSPPTPIEQATWGRIKAGYWK